MPNRATTIVVNGVGAPKGRDMVITALNTSVFRRLPQLVMGLAPAPATMSPQVLLQLQLTTVTLHMLMPVPLQLTSLRRLQPCLCQCPSPP